MRKNLKILCAIFLVFSSCKKVNVPNIEACGHYDNKVFCKKTLSKDEKLIILQKYDLYMDGRISMNVKDWAKLKIFIDQICIISKKCTKEIEEIKKKIEDLETTVKEKKYK